MSSEADHSSLMHSRALVNRLVSRAKEVLRLEEAFNSKAQEFLEWAKAETDRLGKIRPKNARESVEAALSQLQTFGDGPKAEKAVVLLQLRTELDLIQLHRKQDNLKDFRPPQDLEQLSKAWDALETAQQEKLRELETEMERHMKIGATVHAFDRQTEQLLAFHARKQEYLESMQKQESDSTSSKLRERLHQEFEDELAASERRLQEAESLCGQLKQLNYAELPRVEQSLADLKQKWAQLGQDGATVRASLRQSVARAEEKDSTTRGYQQLVKETRLWLQTTALEITSSGFGRSLAAVKEWEERTEKQDAEILGEAEKRVSGVRAAEVELMEEKGVPAGDVSKDRELVEQDFAELQKSLAARKEGIQRELEEQTRFEGLRAKYTELAEGLLGKVSEIRKACAEIETEDPNAALETVASVYEGGRAIDDLLSQCRKLDAEAISHGFSVTESDLGPVGGGSPRSPHRAGRRRAASQASSHPHLRISQLMKAAKELDFWISTLKHQLTEEARLKSDYTGKSAGLLEWIHGQKSELEDFAALEAGNSLQTTQEVFQEFKTWRLEQKATKAAEKELLESLYQNAVDLCSKGQHPRPGFAPETPLEMIASAWTELEKAETARNQRLLEEQARHEQLTQLISRFEAEVQSLEAFCQKTTAELQSLGGGITSVDAAQLALSRLESCRQDTESHKVRLRALQQLLAEILELKPNAGEELKAKAEGVGTQFANFDEVFAGKQAELEETRELEEKRTAAGLKFAQEIAEFQVWLEQKTLSVKANSVDFGGNLSAIRAYQVPLDMETKSTNKQCTKRKSKLQSAMEACEELGVDTAQYSEISPEHIDALAASLLEILESRQTVYQAELERHERMAGKQEEYSKALTDFSALLESTMQKVRALEGESEAVLGALAELWQDSQPLQESLEQVRALHAECLEMGIPAPDTGDGAGDRVEEQDRAGLSLAGLSLKLRMETTWVQAYQAALREEEEEKTRYEQSAKTLVLWIQANRVMLEDTSVLDNTESTARRLVAEFKQWREIDKVRNAALKTHVLGLAERIRHLTETSPYNRPEHRPSDGHSPEEIERLWEELVQKEEQRDTLLAEELHKQEQLTDLHDRFLSDAEAFGTWLSRSEESLAEEETVAALGAALRSVSQLEVSKDELELYDGKREALGDLVVQMKSLGGHQGQAAVDGTLKGLVERFEKLKELAVGKDHRLRDSLTLEENKERARGDFVRVAAQYASWQKRKLQTVESASFGGSLNAVQESKQRLQQDDAGILEEDESRREQVREAVEELRRLGVSEEEDAELRRLTDLTSESVQALSRELKEALEQRQAECEEQIQFQTQIEDLRLEFARKAEDFSEQCEKMQTGLNQLEGEPPAVLEGIAATYQEGTALRAQLQELQALDTRLKEEFQAFTNPHARLSAEQCQQQFLILDSWVQSFQEDLREEQVRKEEYNSRAAEFIAWVSESITQLEDPRAVEQKQDNTLESMWEAVRAFQDWKLREKALKDAFREETVALFEAIESECRSSKHNRPSFTPEISAEQIREAWQELLDKETRRQEILSQELRRQERLASNLHLFQTQSAEIDAWLRTKEAYLREEDQVQDLNSTQVCMSRLDATVVEIRAWKPKHDALQDLAALLEELEHPDQDTLRGTTEALLARYAALPELQAAKQEALDRLREQEQAKEDARIRWSKVASEFEAWVKAKMLSINTSGFGSTLEAVTEYAQILDPEDAGIEEERRAHLETCEQADEALLQLGVEDRKYTEQTLDSIQELSQLLTERLQERRTAYQTELQRQQTMETKRLEFANLADHFMDLVEAQRTEMEEKTGPPLEVLAGIREVYQGGVPVQEALEAVMRCDAERKDLNILTNKHTPFTYSACQRQAQMLAHFVSRFEAELEEEHERRTEYDQMAEGILAWIAENIGILSDFSLLDDNTLEAVQHLMREFEAWREQSKAPKAAELKMAHLHANKLKGSLARSKHTRPPFEPQHSLQELDDRWKELTEKERIRDQRLREELERQEKLTELYLNRFLPAAADMEAWLSGKEDYLAREEPVQSLSEAEAQVTALEASNAEVQHHQTTQDELLNTAQQIADLRHRDQAEIDARAQGIRERFQGLAELSAGKRARLEAALSREQDKETARQDWSKLVREYSTWQVSTIRVLSLKQNFGVSLAAVEAHRSILDEEDAGIRTEEERRSAELQAAEDRLLELGVEDRKYSPETMADIAASRSELEAYMEKRQQEYTAELERQQAMEAKRLEFAETSERMMRECDSIQQQLCALTGEPQEVLEGVERIYSEGAPVQELLEQVQAVDEESQALGILRNPHTTNTVDKARQRSRLLATWVDSLVAELKSEQSNKEEFDRQALLLLNWIEESLGMLQDRSGLRRNTLEAVHELLADLKTWKRTSKAQHAALRRATLALGQEIVKSLEASEKIQRPDFNPPHTPEMINEKWQNLLDAEAERDTVLNNELARQVQLTTLHRRFQSVAEEIEQNLSLKEQYLRSRETIDSLDSARLHIHALAASDEEMRAWKPQRDELESLGTQILDLRHKDAEEIQARRDELLQRYDALETLSGEKAAALQEGLRMEEVYEQTRLEWVRLVESYEAWQQATILQLEKHDFGSTLEEVESFGPTLEAALAELEAEHTQKLEQLEAVDGRLEELRVEDRKYTKVTLPGIRRLESALRGAVAERRHAYSEELVHQLAMEAKKQDFKRVAEDFIQHCDESERAMSALDSEPDPAIAGLARIYDEGQPTREKLDAVERVWTEALGLGITHPEHTQVTVEICVQREQFLHQYHRSYLTELQEEKRDKHDYEVHAEELLDWIETQARELQDFTALREGTLDAVRMEMQRFILWRNRDKAQKGALKSRLEALSAQIIAKLQASRHKRPEFNPGEEMTIEAIQAGWEELLRVELERESRLTEELQRQETLHDKFLEFQRRSEEMESWLEGKEAFLKDDPKPHDVQSSQVHIAAVEAFILDREGFAPKLEALQELVASMQALQGGHKRQPEIDAELESLRLRFEALLPLSGAKKANLEAHLHHQELCEEARRTWVRLVTSYVRWQEEQLLNIQLKGFGDTLTAVTEHRALLEAADGALRQENEARMQEITETEEVLTQLGVPPGDRKYTNATLEEMQALSEALLARIKARQFAYEMELKRQQDMENKRKEFARLCEEFVTLVQEMRSEMENLRGPAEEVLHALHAAFDHGRPLQQKLDELEECDREAHEAGITSNEYTELTVGKCSHMSQALQYWVRNFVKELNAEIQDTTAYSSNSRALLRWMEENRAKLEDIESAIQHNTLAGVRAALAEFQQWRETERSDHATLLQVCLDLHGKIVSAVEKSEHHRPEFEPEIGVQELQALWALLLEAEQQRDEALKAELSRQERLFDLHERFTSQADAFQGWLIGQERFLNAAARVTDVSSATVQRAMVESSTQEIEAARSKRDSLEALGGELRELRHKELEGIEGKLSDLLQRYQELIPLNEAKRKEAEGLVRAQEIKESYKTDWEAKSREYADWQMQQLLRIPLAGFGHSLQEVQEYEAKMQTEDTEMETADEAKIEELRGLSSALETSRVKAAVGIQGMRPLAAPMAVPDSDDDSELGLADAEEDVFDRRLPAILTLSTMERLSQQLRLRREARRSAYARELARQHQMEDKRLEFAAATDAFRRACEETHARMQASRGRPEAVLAEIQEHWEEGETVRGLLDRVNRLHQESLEQGIHSNQHTELSVADCRQMEKVLRRAVESFLWELETESSRKQEYDAKSRALVDWIAEYRPQLEDLSPLEENTLSAVRQEIHLLKEWRLEQKAPHQNLLTEILNLANKICSELEKSKYERPEFEPEFGTEGLKSRWQELLTAEQARDETLRRELERQEKLTALYSSKFLPAAEELETWLSAKEDYLEREEVVESLSEAEAQIIALEASNAEVQHNTANRDALASTAQQIAELRHKLQEEIDARAQSIMARYTALGELAETKNRQLQAALSHEQEKETARLEWARLASEYMTWQKSAVLGMTGSSDQFGDTLKAVREYKEVLDAEDAETKAQDDSRLELLAAAEAQLLQLGVEDRKYSSETITSIQELSNELAMNIAARQAAYAQELERQEVMEAKRQEFAAAAHAFVKEVEEQEARLDALEGEPEEVFAAIHDIYQDGQPLQALLADLETTDKEAQDLGITENEHTFLTVAKCAQKAQRLDSWVRSFQAELLEEQRLKAEYAQRSEELVNWVERNLVNLRDISEVLEANSLEVARQAVMHLKLWRQNDKAVHAAMKAEILAVCAKVEQQMKASIHHRPDFEPEISMQDLNDEWEELLSAERFRDEKLAQELNRQLKLADLLEEFMAAADVFEHWLAVKEDYLEREETVDSLDTASIMLQALEVSNAEVEQSRAKKDLLQRLGSDLRGLGHRELEDIDARLELMVSRYAALEGRSLQKGQLLQAALAKEQAKEQCRQEWAKLADEYLAWQQERVISVSDADFGNTLAEVRSYMTSMNEEDAAINTVDQDKLTALEAAWEEMQRLGVVDLKYTNYTLNDLRGMSDELGAALYARQDQYIRALERHEKMEAKRLQYKEAAESFMQVCHEMEATIESLEGEPDTVISGMAQAYQDGNLIKQALLQVRILDEEAEALEVLENEHTNITVDKCVERTVAVQQFYHDYVLELQEEKRDKHEYEELGERLADWMEESLEQLSDFGCLEQNTLDAVRSALKEFQDWRILAKAEYSSLKYQLETLGQKIIQGLAASKHRRPDFSPSSGLSLSEIEQLWSRLLDAEKNRDTKLSGELARQEALAALRLQVEGTMEEVQDWLQGKEKYLESPEDDLRGVGAVQTHLAALEASNAEVKAWQPKLDAIQTCVEEMHAQQGCHEQEAIDTRARDLQSRFDALEELAEAKQTRLQSALSREEARDKARQEWSRQAETFRAWAQSQVLELQTSGFGDSLSSVESAQYNLNREEERVREQARNLREALDGVGEELEALGVEEEDLQYTKLRRKDIEADAAALDAKLEERQRVWREELEHQQSMEAKRREYAQAVDSFEEVVERTQHELGDIHGDPDSALQELAQRYAEGAEIQEALQTVSRVHQEALELNIQENEYTAVTLADCQQRAKAVEEWVSEFQAELEEERRAKEEYKTRSEDLLAWVKANSAALTDSSEAPSRSLDAVREALQEFTEWRTEDKAGKHAEMQAVLRLAEKIEDGLRESTHQRPAFIPAVSVNELEQQWDTMLSAERKRYDVLTTELARQERLLSLRQQFEKLATELSPWLAEKEEYFAEEDIIPDLRTAQMLYTGLEAVVMEMSHFREKRNTLEQLFGDIQSEGVQDSDLEDRLQEILGRFDNLATQRDSKQYNLTRALSTEQSKEQARLKWSALVQDYLAWHQKHSLGLETPNFGDSLHAVKAFRKTLAEEDRGIQSEDRQKLDALRKADQNLNKLNVVNRVYAPESLSDLQTLSAELQQKLQDRKQAYAAELSRQEEMESKRKEFAAAASGFIELVGRMEERFLGASGKPGNILGLIQTEYQSGEPIRAQLQEVERVDQLCKEFQIQSNEHTELTVDRCRHRAAVFEALVTQLLEEVRTEQEATERYESESGSLLQWMQQSQKQLQDLSGVDTDLESVQRAIQDLREYRLGEKSERDTQRRSLEAQEKKIQELLASSKLKRPVFSPRLSPAELQKQWDTLETQEEKRETQLRALLEKQEKLTELRRIFQQEVQALEAYVADTRAFYEASQPAESLEGAQLAMATFRTRNEELANQRARKDRLKQLVTDIRRTGPPADQREIEKQLRQSTEAFDSLSSLKDKKGSRLKEDLARQRAREEACHQFARTATEYILWARDIQEQISQFTFGNSFEQVKAAGDVLRNEDSEIRKQNQKQSQRAEQSFRAAADLSGGAQNLHTDLTSEDISAVKQEVESALAARQAAFQAQMQHFQQVEAKQKEFADAVETLLRALKEVQGRIEVIQKSKDSEQSRIAAIQRIYQDGAVVQQPFDRVAELDAACKELGAMDNPYTLATLPGLQERLERFKAFVNSQLAVAEDDLQSAAEVGSQDALEQRKLKVIELRLKFAALASRLKTWIEEVYVGTGADLEPMKESVMEIAEHRQVWQKYSGQINSSQQTMAQIRGVLQEMEKAGSQDYGSHDPEELEAEFQAVLEHLRNREAALDQVKSVQEQASRLRRQYAQALQNFLEWNEAHCKALSKIASGASARDPVEKQLQSLDKLAQDYQKSGTRRFAALENIHSDLQHSGVSPTGLSEKEATSSSKSFQQIAKEFAELPRVLESTREALQAEQVRRASSEVSPEQRAELEKVFQKFDRNSNGSLSSREFKNALESLGERKSNDEVDGILKRIAPDKMQVQLEDFVSYVASQQQGIGSQEDILTAFRAVTAGKDVITKQQLLEVMDEDSAEYLATVMPQVDGGYDFQAWISESVN